MYICECTCHIQNNKLYFSRINDAFVYGYMLCWNCFPFLTVKLSYYQLGREEKHHNIHMILCLYVLVMFPRTQLLWLRWMRAWKAKYLLQQNFHDSDTLLCPQQDYNRSLPGKNTLKVFNLCYLIECDTLCGFFLFTFVLLNCRFEAGINNIQLINSLITRYSAIIKNESAFMHFPKGQEASVSKQYIVNERELCTNGT